MRIDVTLLGISGNSLRWLRRLAPWSIVPLVLGALVLATVALGSVRYSGPANQNGWGAYHHNVTQPAMNGPIVAVEQPLTTATVTLNVGQEINVIRQPGWSEVSMHGKGLQPSGYMMYRATEPGKAVLTASQGLLQWKYTVTIVAGTRN
jgi:hypothetical protein